MRYLIAIILTLTASSAWGQGHYLGGRPVTLVRVYVGDVNAAWASTSSCIPCNAVCRDVRKINAELKRVGGNGYRVGFVESPDVDIVILKAPEGAATPYTETVRDGRVIRVKRGYTAPVETWVREVAPWPIVERRVSYVAPVVRETVRYSTPVYTAPRYVAPYRARWTFPGDLRSHLITHGYSPSYLSTLSYSQMLALHDSDHDRGRVTPWGQQRWPIAQAAPVVSYAPPVRYAAPYYRSGGGSSYRQSSGFQMFGIPIMGSYRSGSSGGSFASACPGGVCP